jgi:dimethylhistidine N-methyltransferase
MPLTAARAQNVFFEDQQPVPSDSRAELLAGLQRPQKQVNPKYFYDAAGSNLFEQITRLDEYYPTRTEMGILRRHAEEIAEFCSDDCVLIEPGSGNSEKVRLLLNSMRPAAYVPLDISADFLYESAVKLGREFPWLQVHAICADFASQWHARATLPVGRRVIFYPGSTIGNMEPSVAQKFLADLRQWIGADGGVLIGVDLHKSEHLLNAAYNDASGVTAKFNLNILSTINRIAEADFDAQAFSHKAIYNRQLKRIEMHLVSDAPQTVNVNGSAIEFIEGETLHTENSYKYSLEDFQALIKEAGFILRKSWLDEKRLFSVHFLAVSNS